MSGGSWVAFAAAMEWLPYVPPLPPIPPSRVQPYFEAQASALPFSVSCRSYHFNYPSTVTLLQILVSLVFMYALRAAGVMQFSGLTLQGARKVGGAAALLCCAAACCCVPHGHAMQQSVRGGPQHHACGCSTTCNPSLAAVSPGGCHVTNRCAASTCSVHPCAQVAPLALFWWLYVVSGVTALRYLNVPMYRCASPAVVFVLLAACHPLLLLPLR